MRLVLCLSAILIVVVVACQSEPTPIPATPTASPPPASGPARAAPPAAVAPAIESSPSPAPAATAAPVMPTRTQTAIPSPVPPPTLQPAATPVGEPPTQSPTATLPPTRLPPATSTLTRETSVNVDDQDLATLAAGNTSFALALYRQVAGEGDENLFFSPYSISLALAMTYAGAAGETEIQMAETLSFRLSQEGLHPAFNALDQELASRSEGEDDGFQLNIANSVWGQRGHGFLPDFLDTLALNYGGKVRDVDFRGSPEEARLGINDWVEEETAGKIEDLIPMGVIDRFTRLVLANAVYFKADWESQFEKTATSTAPFHALDGSEISVDMMRQTERFGYARGDGYQAVDLPYKGGAISMTILLPGEDRFGEFESALDSDRLEAVLRDLEDQRVRLTMPKFELEASLGLADTLAVMGMPNAFDERMAEFQGMDGLSCLAGDDECLLISDVLHKAFVSVDEAGTEAAAATAVIIGITRADPEEPINLTIDRPFIYLIRDHETGAILFLGRVVKL